MKMSILQFATLFVFISISNAMMAQSDFGSDSVGKASFHRHYEIGIAPFLDLNTVSRNGLTAYKLLQDAYSLKLQPRLPKTLGKIAGGIWSFSITYLTMIWPHEFGHSLRAKQAGGAFRIHNVALPIPYTTMHLPADVSLTHRALSVTGGFEVNYLSSKSIQNDFLEYDGLYNDELALAFAHRLMYPIYVSLVIPRNPADKDTWIHTAGDPVHYIAPVWENYSDNAFFLSDSTVHPGLVSFYRQSALFATFWNLLDPTFYQEISALFGDVRDGKRPWYLLGDRSKGWTVGTMFNVSPLGYEVFLNNYLSWKNRLYILQIKSGRPFKNNAISLSCPNILHKQRLKLGGAAEVWDQDLYGKGFLLSTDVSASIGHQLSLEAQIGYKSRGYTLGRTTENHVIAWLGIRYQLEE